MNEQQQKLREPFSEEQVGKLPRLTCKACSESPRKHCGDHRKQRCEVCDNYISTAHIHLDYVGHAAVTHRLLEVDPSWTWEPMAVDAAGNPVLTDQKSLLLSDERVGLWIKLTIAGVTRVGFGGGKNAKEAIGDAIRNAAMRFGVALDLWAKQDLLGTGEDSATVVPLIAAPRTWAEISDGFAAIDADYPFGVWIEEVVEKHYAVPEVKQLDDADKADAGRRLSAVVVTLHQQTVEAPLTDDLVRAAFASAFEGLVLEGPQADAAEAS